MLIFVPITRVDYHLAVPLFKLMGVFGGVQGHTMVVAFMDRAITEVDKEFILAEAMKLGDKVYSITHTFNVEYGWPRSANLVFQTAAMIVEQNGAYGEPCWYFFELDNCPVVPDWVGRLARAYEWKTAIYYGVREYKPVSNNEGEDGSAFMLGTGIYPPDTFSRANMCRHLHIIGERFDWVLRPQITPYAWPTKMIASYRRTLEYCYAGGSKHLVYGAKVLNDDGSTRLNVVSDKKERTIDLTKTSPVVVHGCKDTSLIQLISKRFSNTSKVVITKQDVEDDEEDQD